MRSRARIDPRLVLPVVGVLLFGALIVFGERAIDRSTRAGERPRTRVRLAYFPNLTHAPALIGVAEGRFQRALGPAVELSPKVVNAGPEAMQALLAGEIDLAYVGPSPATNAYLRSAGKALRIVAGAASGGASLVAAGDSRIEGVKDLGGKKVAVPQLGGTQDVSLRHFIAAAGFAPVPNGGTVDIIPGGNADILTLFKQHRIDAAWVPEPWATRIVLEAGGRRAVDERDLWPGHRFATTVLVARTGFLGQHPELVGAMVKENAAIIAWIAKSPKAAMNAANAQLKVLSGKALSDEVLSESWSRLSFEADPNRASIEGFAEAAFECGYAKQRPGDLSGLFHMEAGPP
ncbi:MAG: ABC transporter substrate-binding protein [Fimbriimonas ginsengisoli]|uniref:ABC transporter substrate-binding protein n=1 Tax=Fimbriimonas ginsengisoli TaxID=1005039 RepID=A0A931LWW0_FIMGI|nr:ABC transporter substrate-binding protein [Fimbriimonas ginsengisoli]